MRGGTVFDEYAEKYDAWFLENQAVLASEVRLVAHVLRDAGRILSVGCGSGLFELLLRRDFGITVGEGVEPAAAMAEIARKRGMEVAVAGAESLPHADGTFDTVVFNGSPSYIKDLRVALGEARRVLRPGGRVVVIDVPRESGYALLYNLAKEVGSWDHPYFRGVKPRVAYPIEFVVAANWRTTPEKAALLDELGFTELRYAQTLTRHPAYSDDAPEDPCEGYDRGDYVAITARRP